MSRAVIIEFTKDEGGMPKGSRFEIESAARANQVYPEARIVRYADGAPYVAGVMPAPTGLAAMTREQLNAQASELGIVEPDQFPNKAALVAAIESQAPAAGGPATETNAP